MKIATHTYRMPRRQFAVYVILAFVIAWASWFPAFAHAGAFRLLSFVGLFAPALAAVLVTWWYDGAAGVRKLFGRYLILRFNGWWYVFSLLVVPLLFIIVLGLEAILFRMPFTTLFLPSPVLFVIVSFGWLCVINSGEEIGWRGFALPRLQMFIRNPIAAAVLLGLIWSLWHLPIYLVPGQSSIPWLAFVFFTTGLSLIYSAVFDRTRGSLVPAVFLHAGTDIVPRMLNIVGLEPKAWYLFGVLCWTTGLVLLLVLRPTAILRTSA